MGAWLSHSQCINVLSLSLFCPQIFMKFILGVLCNLADKQTTAALSLEE